MNITVICAGRLKEKFYADACAEFKKRISRYADLKIAEVRDEKAPEGLSPAGAEEVRKAEGLRMLRRLSPGDYLIAMDMGGEPLSSQELAGRLRRAMIGGKSSIAFAVGGSLGLSGEVLSRADLRVSFGRATFSHQIFRVMLLEQIYRCFKIINGEPYHK